jgi:hypothetical protein
MKALVLAGVLTIFAASVAHAGDGGPTNAGDHNGRSGASMAGGQHQNGGVQNDGGRGGMSGDV